eukprot:Opistho-1_new@56189
MLTVTGAPKLSLIAAVIATVGSAVPVAAVCSRLRLRSALAAAAAAAAWRPLPPDVTRSPWRGCFVAVARGVMASAGSLFRLRSPTCMSSTCGGGGGGAFSAAGRIARAPSGVAFSRLPSERAVAVAGGCASSPPLRTPVRPVLSSWPGMTGGPKLSRITAAVVALAAPKSTVCSRLRLRSALAAAAVAGGSLSSSLRSPLRSVWPGMTGGPKLSRATAVIARLGLAAPISTVCSRLRLRSALAAAAVAGGGVSSSLRSPLRSVLSLWPSSGDDPPVSGHPCVWRARSCVAGSWLSSLGRQVDSAASDMSSVRLAPSCLARARSPLLLRGALRSSERATAEPSFRPARSSVDDAPLARDGRVNGRVLLLRGCFRAGAGVSPSESDPSTPSGSRTARLRLRKL